MEGLELERKRAICTKAALGPGVRNMHPCHVHVFNLFRSDVLSERRGEGVKANNSKSGRMFLFVRVISNIKAFLPRQQGFSKLRYRRPKRKGTVTVMLSNWQRPGC